MASRRRLLAALFVATLLCAGSSCVNNPPPTCDDCAGGLDDHTVASLTDVAGFERLATAGPSSTALKFVLTRFASDAPRLRFLDGAHYALHDEWYWFRLLNGGGVDGLPDRPVDVGRHFDAIADIVSWARGQAALPLDLTFVGDRLYSPRFYNLALFSSPRALGIGTLLHFPSTTSRSEVWAIELEFQDHPTRQELARFFDAVTATTPAEIGGALRWLPRSQAQEDLAQALVDTGDPLGARVIRYRDVTTPGATEVYAEGLAAGRLLVVRRGEEALLATSRPTDVLVLQDTPDYLPPCAAMLTSVPQTALAHVNLLARNRGIPNAYRDGILDDPGLDQLARVRAPVLVQARAPDGLVVQAISDDDFNRYRALVDIPPSALPPIDVATLPYAVDLSTLRFADADQWRPALGGKSVGFLALLNAATTTVDRPLGISIRAYVEHVDTTTGLRPRLVQMLAHPDFIANAATRTLVLEGAGRVDAGSARAFFATHPRGDVLRDLVDDGGVQGIIRTTPIAPATLSTLRAALDDHFGRYAATQPLRFRSSSNIEDKDGFNGAGLYTSNSGWLHPQDSGEPSLQARTVEAALRQTWASYWGSEAFEERRLAAIDHLSGAMGVCVHAAFPDDNEDSNGVFTFTWLPPQPDGTLPEGRAVLELNLQDGAFSVTNPPPGSADLPEVDRVREDVDGSITIERLRASTRVPAGTFVLDDAQLRTLFAQARDVTTLWLDVDNATLPPSQARSTLTLDFELRQVTAGWPALRDDVTASEGALPARIVLKQARTLEPGIRAPDDVTNLPIPRDLLARARRVQRHSCTGSIARVVVTEVLTESDRPPAMGYDVVPFTSFAIVQLLADVPTWSATAGEARSAVHTAFSSVAHPGVVDDTTWALDVAIDPARSVALGLGRIAIGADGSVHLEDGTGTPIDDSATCETTTLYAAPSEFLEGLLSTGP